MRRWDSVGARLSALALVLLAACGVARKGSVSERGDSQRGDSGDTAPPDGDSACELNTWYADEDGDGFGDVARSQQACVAPAGFVADHTDCDDADSAINPAAPELCATTADDNCDGLTNDSTATDALAWYPDADQDGYGEPTAPVMACSAVGDMVADATDCDDTNADIRPGARDVCNDSIDQDCDGADRSCPYSGEQDLMSAASTVTGVSSMDMVPISLAPVGDLDGDGQGDVALGYSTSGVCVLDHLGGLRGDHTLEDCDAVLTDDTISDHFGSAVSGGDANGDGSDDLLVTAYVADVSAQNAGEVLIFSGPLGSTDLHSADAGATLLGENASDGAGIDAILVDLDGDGVADVVTGAAENDDGGTEAGTVYVEYGPVTGTVDLGSSDVLLAGAAGDHLGSQFAPGDFDGDGRTDLAVGACYESEVAYLAGGVSIFNFASPLAPVRAVHITGNSEGADFGAALDAADFDGSGKSDLVASAPEYGADFHKTGMVYVFNDPSGPALMDSDADVMLEGDGTSSSDNAGALVGSAGDINGDGFADLMLTAPGHTQSGYGPGEGYLFYGPVSADLRSVNDADAWWFGDLAGSRRYGETEGHVHFGLGDLDGDGYDDFMLPDPYWSTDEVGYLGKLYVFFGSSG